MQDPTIIGGYWRDMLVTSLLVNAFLSVVVLWFRATLLRDIKELKVRIHAAEQMRAEKAELKALAVRVEGISRDYASREDIEKISTKLDNIYVLFMNYARKPEDR